MQNSIIEALASFFGNKFHEKLKRTETLHALIDELCKKKKKLNKKLKKEPADSEREFIQSQLSVLEAQIKKAQTKLDESQELSE